MHLNARELNCFKSDSVLTFSLKNNQVKKVLSLVLVIHLLIFLLSFFGLPDFKIAKRPDITIEIGAAPPESSGPVNQAKPTPVPEIGRASCRERV
jgi:hypothetical protein